MYSVTIWVPHMSKVLFRKMMIYGWIRELSASWRKVTDSHETPSITARRDRSYGHEKAKRDNRFGGSLTLSKGSDSRWTRHVQASEELSVTRWRIYREERKGIKARSRSSPPAYTGGDLQSEQRWFHMGKPLERTGKAWEKIHLPAL